MAASRDHYCRREIEEMTVLRNVDFSVQAVPCLVFVTLNEFGVVCARVCMCGENESQERSTTGLISKTHLIDFCPHHLFVLVFKWVNRHTSWVMLLSHGGRGRCLVYEYVLIVNLHSRRVGRPLCSLFCYSVFVIVSLWGVSMVANEIHMDAGR